MASEGGGEEMMTPSTSPRSRLKILCSHGGKILPRPTDGHLKYVGGETRMVALARNITYSDLMKKLTSLYDGNMVLKYQLLSEDLDALVSVKTDDDLRHMLDEYDRQENKGGSPKLRAFLFPSNPTLIENQVQSHSALEQRYIDSINGIIRTSTSSSACSSPKTRSPDKFTRESSQESMLSNGRISHMHKVRSSPSLCSLGDQNSTTTTAATNHHHIHHHHYYHNHHQVPSNYSSKPPQDPYKGYFGDNFVPNSYSNARVDNLRGHTGSGPYDYRRFDRSDSLPRTNGRALWE